MKEQIAELEDRLRINYLPFTSTKERVGEENNKVKVFVQKKLGLYNGRGNYCESTLDSKGKKREKRRIIIAKYSNKQRESVINRYRELKLWEDQIHVKEV